MKGPYQMSQFAVTFDGGDDPDYTLPVGLIPLFSTDYDTAMTEAIQVAERNGVPSSQLRVFYRIQITGYTEWTEVGDDSDYREVVDRVLNMYRQNN